MFKINDLEKNNYVACFERFIHQSNVNQRNQMLGYAITFLIIALIAGVLGFTGVMGAAAYIAKILLVVFLILFVVSLIAGRRPPV